MHVDRYDCIFFYSFRCSAVFRRRSGRLCLLTATEREILTVTSSQFVVQRTSSVPVDRQPHSVKLVGRFASAAVVAATAPRDQPRHHVAVATPARAA